MQVLFVKKYHLCLLKFKLQLFFIYELQMVTSIFSHLTAMIRGISDCEGEGEERRREERRGEERRGG